MTNKIGVGVITCDRPEFLANCLNSITAVDTLVVVNDGRPVNVASQANADIHVIEHTRKKSVGVSKNEAMRYLISQQCDHIFLIEDDMLITDPDVFTHYIKGAEVSGIWHMNFGYHGPANMHNGVPTPREVITYDGIDIAFNANCVGSFSYYLAGVIKQCGYMDERFFNAWEHVEHTYNIIKAGLHPPFWWFADLADSHKYIKEQASSEVNSAIRKSEEWYSNLRSGALLFKQKHGAIPTHIPQTAPEKVIKELERIQQYYARKVL